MSRGDNDSDFVPPDATKTELRPAGPAADADADSRQAVQALRRSERRYRSFVEVVSQFAWVTDPDGQVVEDIPALRQFTGQSYEQARGSGWADALHPDDYQRALDVWRRAVRTRTPYQVEYRMRRHDGVYRLLQARGVPILDESGEVLEWVGTCIDVTDSKQAEQALRDSEHFHRQMLESIPGMVFTTRPDGFCDYQSQQWVEYTGVPVSEHLGDGWTRLLHPDDRERAFAAWRDAVEERGPYDVEYRVRRHDGTYEWFKVRGRPIRDANGKIVRWFGVATNIEEHRRTEDALREAKADLEQKVQRRTEQLAQRAAQLRALAAELTLSEQRERRRMAKVLHDHLQQLLVGAKFRTTIIRQTGDRSIEEAAREIERLLDDAILASRSLTAELSPPILHEGGLAAGLEWLGRWMADKHQLIVEVAIEPAPPPLDEDVKVLLFESVRELLFNVVKHARVSRAQVSLARTDDQVRVRVGDAGAGFDPKRVRRAGQVGGGFGLFSIQERLDLIGGRMHIDTAPGRGSHFTLWAPIRTREPAAPPPAALSAPADREPTVQVTSPLLGAPIRVLLADDHVVMREGLARLLGQEPDINVVGQARDGAEAVALAGRLLPDVVLMDMSMPKLNGIEATREIHRAHPDIRIIGLSMFAEADRAKALLDAGGCQYLTKSGPTGEVVAAIRQCRSGLESAKSAAASAAPRSRRRK